AIPCISVTITKNIITSPIPQYVNISLISGKFITTIMTSSIILRIIVHLTNLFLNVLSILNISFLQVFNLNLYYIYFIYLSKKYSANITAHAINFIKVLYF